MPVIISKIKFYSSNFQEKNRFENQFGIENINKNFKMKNILID